MVTNAGQCHYAAVDRRNGVSATFKRIMRRTPLTSRNMKRFAASRGAALVLAGLLVLGSGLTAAAQSKDWSPKGLEGTWRVQLTVMDCQTGQVLRTFPTLFAFAKGGTLTVTTAGQFPALNTTGLGIW